MEKQTWNKVLALFAIVVVFGAGLFLMNTLVPVQQRDEAFIQFVSGTEYNIGEAGQVIVEARFANSTSALQNGSCQILVWYPNKSLFLNQTGVSSASESNYITFTIPNITGVYEYQAQCVLPGNREGIISKSFHVSEFQNDTFTKLNRIRAVTPK